MPHHRDDDRHPHLELIREEPTPDRRRRPAPPAAPPDRGGRSNYAAQLRKQLTHIEEEATARPAPPAGIHPHLVFRVPLAGGASPQTVIELLERIGIHVVSIEADNAIIAFKDNADLTQFRHVVDRYGAGPQQGINPQTDQPYASTQWDVLEYIEAPQMRLWGREDRIGVRLLHRIGDRAQTIVADELYILDVELWHRGTVELARGAIQELRQLIADSPAGDEQLTDSFVGQLLCLARVAVRGQVLDALLNLDIVAEVELPPQPRFDHRQAARQTRQDFAIPAMPDPAGPVLCVVDSGLATKHPLLAKHVGHADSVMNSTESSADEHGHGTMVGGVAVFGDIRACYEAGAFSSPVTLFSARVLDADNRFDDEALIIHQMRRAIQLFHVAPYNCRVFNMSLGDNRPWLTENSRQSLWAESLDTLAREFNVVLILSAGNHDLGWSSDPDEAEEILASYPNLLFDPACALCEPATAAIPITVGGVADRDAPAVPGRVQNEDVFRSIASEFEPTPTTRIGPGINGAIKPEFVAPAGNLAFQGFSSVRRVDDDPGLAVMSFSHEPMRSLFAFDIGTSFAAARISRTAAILWNSLEQQVGSEPQANLVRALLASGAEVPRPLHERIHPEHGDEGIRRVCGYGLVDDEHVFVSSDRRTTLFAQDSLPIDSFAVYEVPAPDEFRTAIGQKRVIVTLAYDPPVRRRRADYLGVRMDYALFRGKSLEEIVGAYRQLSEEERAAARRSGDAVQGAFQNPFKCPLQPGPRALQNSTLQRSEWVFTREGNDYGDTWYLVVRAQRVWAPDTFEEQNFAVTVTLRAEEPKLYNLLRNRIRLRQQQRARTRG